MFRQVKSALFWYYLYKFRKRVIIIAFLLIVALFANSIYADVIEYLKLKDKLQFLELALFSKWGIIITNIMVSIYLILTLFKKDVKNEKEIKKEKRAKVKEFDKKEEKKVENLTQREESFLKKKKLRTQAEILLGD